MVATLTMVATAGALHSQAANRNVLSVEANPFRGTIGYARRSASGTEIGLSLGFGFPQLDQTLFASHVDFRDYLHIGPFVRRDLSARVLVELSLRGGIAEYHHCDSSDCFPGAYVGSSVMVAVGGKRVKVGARVTSGVIWEPGRDASGFAGLSPLNLVMKWAW